MKKFIQHPLIFENMVEARVYQQLIFSEAIKKNTLIVLPTGLGKTIIMLMLIANKLKTNPNSLTIIIAPTKPLIDQHNNTVNNLLNINKDQINVLTGKIPPKSRANIWDSSKIIICTPQVMRNDILSGTCPVNKISLLLIDEAHRLVGDDPYVFPVKYYYKKFPKENHIVGFTASPGNYDKTKEIISNLAAQSIEYFDENHPTVKPYIHQTEEEWIFIENPKEIKTIIELLKSLLIKHLKYLKTHNIIESSQIVKNPRVGLLKLPKRIQELRKIIEDDVFYESMTSYGQLMLISHTLELVETQGLLTTLSFLEKKKEEFLVKKKKSIKLFLQSNEIQEIVKMSENLIKSKFNHPKQSKLYDLISNKIQSKEDSRILIFANYKSTIEFLVKDLNRIKGVSALKFVGQAGKAQNKGLSQKEQSIVMEKFRAGEINTLVSTRIGEEGLDVAQCDLVVFYDTPPSAIRLIQRSGRTGRSREGKVVFLIIKASRDEAYFHISKKKKTKMYNAIKKIQNELKQIKRPKLINSSLEQFLEDDHSSNKRSVEVKIVNSQKEDLPTNQERQITIFFDHREKGSNLFSSLLSYDINLIQKELRSGDFILSNRMGVERKTIPDFCQTIIRNELFTQLINLKEEFYRPLLIIEGNEHDIVGITNSAFNGAIISIIADLSIPIIRTVDREETAKYLFELAKREQKIKNRKPTTSKSKSSSKEIQYQLGIISSIPNIDKTLALRLLNRFKSPKNVINATEDELKKVKGIGIQKAKDIINTINKQYVSDIDEIT